MTIKKSEHVRCKAVSETRLISLDMSNTLDSGESFTGTPTVVEVTTSDLTLANKAVSSTALTINGKSVSAGDAIQFTVAGGSAGTRYTIRITCGTDGSPAQTISTNILLDVVAD